jgi:hypothetical protein
MEILLEIATNVDVPPQDIDEGRVAPALADTTEVPSELSHVMWIHTSEDKPADAFISIKYRNCWFWIDDRDPRSRGTLTFLMILFSLAETGGTSSSPLVTIPAG